MTGGYLVVQYINIYGNAMTKDIAMGIKCRFVVVVVVVLC